MKAIIQGAQSIMLGDADVICTGGMESMSNVPYYSPKIRWGNKYGDVTLVDGLAKDGLTDVYKNYAMGNAAELCAKECGLVVRPLSHAGTPGRPRRSGRAPLRLPRPNHFSDVVASAMITGL